MSNTFNPVDHENLIGSKWRDEDNKLYTLIGIMFDVDDWWWVMSRKRKFNKNTQLLSCVCNPEVYGFEEVKDGIK